MEYGSGEVLWYYPSPRCREFLMWQLLAHECASNSNFLTHPVDSIKFEGFSYDVLTTWVVLGCVKVSYCRVKNTFWVDSFGSVL